MCKSASRVDEQRHKRGSRYPETQEQLGRQGGHWKVSQRLDLRIAGKEESLHLAGGEAVCKA